MNEYWYPKQEGSVPCRTRPETEEAEVGETVRIGMITPSSNTCLEPVTYSLLQGTDAVTVHFARVPVTRISLDSQDCAQFALDPMLAAARLLADAQVDVVAWNGTSGSWLGLDQDRSLCRAVQDATGVPVTTSTLALLEACRAFGVSRLGLATPYTGDVATRIVGCYAAAGIEVVAEAHLGIADNAAFADVDAGTLRRLAHQAAGAAQAVAVVCTNLRAAPLVPGLEAALGVPVFDSVAVTLWEALRLAGSQVVLAGRGALLAGGALTAESYRPAAAGAGPHGSGYERAGGRDG